MMSVTIDTTAVVATVGVVTLVGTFTAWMMKLQYRLDSKLSREEHMRICENREKLLAVQLASMETKLDEREKGAIRHRDRVQFELKELSIDMAVMQTKMGIPLRRARVGDDFEERAASL